jgi:flagellar motility protein MotE (MotC chaperone)
MIEFKTKAKIAYLWLKGNIVIIALFVIAVCVALFSASKTKELANYIEETENANRREYQALKANLDLHIRKQQEINDKYNQVLERIQRDYSAQLEQLDKQKEKDLRLIIEKNNDDPQAMARDINILFGIPIFP